MVFKKAMRAFSDLTINILMKIRIYMRKQYYSLNGVSIGASTYISPKAYIDRHSPGKVKIGCNCYITRNVIILCHTDAKRGGPLELWKDIGGKREFGYVSIGNNVFIGVNSVVMPGVTIGNDVIIGALTLVDKDIPDGKVVCGNPGKIIASTKDYFPLQKNS